MILLISILFLWAIWGCIRPSVSLTPFTMEATLPLRGVLAMGIVIHHISLRIVDATPDDMWIFSQFQFWGAPIVAVFFFLSGYGLMVSLITKGQKYLDGFLKKRLLKIVLPLVLCSIVFEATSITLWGGQIADFRKDWPFLPNCWFCVTIIIYYIAFYITGLLLKASTVKVTYAMWVFSFIYVFLFKVLDFCNWWYQMVLSINIGMTLAYYETAIRNVLYKYKRTVVLLLFLLTFMSACWASLYKADIFPLGMMALSLFIGLLTYTSLCLRPIKSNRLLTFFGKYSFEIYLIHGAVISVLFGMAYTYIPHWWHVFTILTFVATFLFAWMLKMVTKVINQRFI